MEAEFVPLAERHHRADDQHAAGALVEMRAGPDLAPGIAGDQVLEVGVERIAVGDRLVDPGVAEDLTARGHPVVAALLVIHGVLPPSLRSFLPSSFRDGPKDQARNLEIPGSMLRIAPE